MKVFYTFDIFQRYIIFQSWASIDRFDLVCKQRAGKLHAVVQFTNECYSNSLGTFLQIVCGYPSKQRIKYYDYICLPMMVFLSFSLMTMGVPLSKSPGNSWWFNGTGFDLVIGMFGSIKNSDSTKDSDLYSMHQCFPLEI